VQGLGHIVWRIIAANVLLPMSEEDGCIDRPPLSETRRAFVLDVPRLDVEEVIRAGCFGCNGTMQRAFPEIAPVGGRRGQVLLEARMRYFYRLPGAGRGN